MTAEPGDLAASVIPDIPYVRRRGGEQRATYFELFFDLVYVFAITQLSHYLLAHLTWAGAAQAAFLLCAVYWAWNYTTWMTNWFDPEVALVRLVLVVVMLASLLMAVAIPESFGDHGLLFAASYCALQVGRNAFVVGVTPPGAFHRNFQQILGWSLLSVPLWIGGGLVHGSARWGLWLAAFGLDLAAPLVRFWLPRFGGGTPMIEWAIDAGHFAERFQLFVIIVLGESIVLTGATATDVGLEASVVVALGFAFLSSVALWWLYFGQVATAPLRRIAAADGWLARAAGTQAMVKDDVAAVRAHLVTVGRDPATLRYGHLNFVHLVDARDRAAALAAQRPRFERVMGTHRSFEQLQQSYLMGPTDEIVDRIADLERAGIEYLVLAPLDYDLEQLDRYAEEIVPRFARG